MADTDTRVSPELANTLFRQLREASLRFCANESTTFIERLKEAAFKASNRHADSAAGARYMTLYQTFNGREVEFQSKLNRQFGIELDRALASDQPPALVEEFAQTRSQLAIVEEDDVQREIEVMRLITELEGLCADTLSGLTLRICYMRNLDTVAVRLNPFRAETFAIGLIVAWESFCGDRSLTPRLLSSFRASDFLPLNALYKELNQILVSRGVMEKERYIVRSKPQSAGALWVRSDITGSAGRDEDAATSTFNAARFLQQLAQLGERLGAVAPAGAGGAPGTPGMTGPSGPSATSATSGAAGPQQAQGRPQGAEQEQPDLAATVNPELIAAVDALFTRSQILAEENPSQHATSALGLGELDAARQVSDVKGGASELDRSTIEMVSRVFDFILDDSAIPVELKVLIADLQLPVLKAALLDREFFLSDAHPARYVVDLLARSAIYWDVLPADGVHTRLREMVQRLRAGKGENFAECAEELGGFLVELDLAYESRLARSIAQVAADERRNEALLEVDRALEKWFSGPRIDPELADFLKGPWRDALAQYVIERGTDPKACKSAFAQTTILIWSLLPKHEAADRERLVRALPELIAHIQAGLDKIHLEPQARAAFLQFLMARHTLAIRGPVQAAPPGQPAATVPDVEVMTPAEEPAEVKRWNALQLTSGDWFMLSDGTQAPLKCRLSWVSPKRTKFVFTVRDTTEALLRTDQEVEALLRSGALKLLDSSPIVQRAIAASFDQTT